MTPRTPLLLSIACALALAAAPAARAAELYGAVHFGLSGGDGDSSGAQAFTGPYSGDDRDSSPVYGAAFGIAVPLVEALPWDLDGLPALSGLVVRTELEGLTGRDYELLTSAPGDTVFSDVKSHSILTNLWFDLPVEPVTRAALGRALPFLLPVSFYWGGGLGLAINEVDAFDAVSSGDKLALNFAFQAGGGFGYRFSERVTLSAGYRYLDMGKTRQNLDNAGTPSSFALDLTAHEFMTTLRVNFWGVPIRRWSSSW